MAGNIGGAKRFEYTVIGDAANEAARLCELAKGDDGSLLASAVAVGAAGGEESGYWRAAEEVELRGRAQATRLARPTDCDDRLRRPDESCRLWAR